MTGESKYNDIVTSIRVTLGAKAVVLVVVGGPLGHGGGTQVTDMALVAPLAKALRSMADDLEGDQKQLN